jgi:hypothetical protein
MAMTVHTGFDETAVSAAESGAPEGTRTPNLLIRSQMLYPLSYGRMFGCRPA